VTVTRHLHHIPGTTIEDEESSKTRRFIGCGGPGTCIDCTSDELDAFSKPPVFIKPKT